MRAVEPLLTGEPRAIHDLACKVYEVDDWDGLTRAQVEAVRRACKRLAELGRAEVQRRPAYSVRPPGAGRAWGAGSSPRFLTARTPPTAAELAERQAVSEALAARIGGAQAPG